MGQKTKPDPRGFSLFDVPGVAPESILNRLVALEAMKAIRAGMEAENLHTWVTGNYVGYGEDAFNQLSDEILLILPDGVRNRWKKMIDQFRAQVAERAPDGK